MIIFLYGPDTFRSHQKLRDLKEKFRKDVDQNGDSISHYQGDALNPDIFRNIFQAASLFSKRRFIIVENIFLPKNKENLAQILTFLIDSQKEAARPDDNIIVFIDEADSKKMRKDKLWNYLLKQQFVQSFPLLSGSALEQWIRERVSFYGASLERSLVGRLVARFGNDLWQLDNEIRKLSAYSLAQGEGGVIQARDWGILSPGHTDENIFALTDAIGSRNKAKALELLENEIEQGKAETYLLHMIMRHYRNLYQIKEAVEAGIPKAKIISLGGFHPFVLEKSLRQLNSFSLSSLKTSFHRLVEIDRNMKSGFGDFLLAMELLIAEA